MFRFLLVAAVLLVASGFRATMKFGKWPRVAVFFTIEYVPRVTPKERTTVYSVSLRLIDLLTPSSFFLHLLFTCAVEMPSVNKVVTAAIAGVMATNSFVMPAEAITKAENEQLSYLQVKGSGLANRCPEVIGEGSINVGGKKLKVTDLCIEPKSWQVRFKFSSVEKEER